ncbi:glycosyltransferase [Streptomyces mirabilis]|uniref:glycosyltransferase family 2 protein n=1 Tax=Streptomyces mirabilis TaxID=68239 RepID=UPI0033D331AD
MVSTIGRTAELEELLLSLESQSHPVSAIVIADQTRDHEVRRLVTRWSRRLPVTRVISSGGASAGRNDGIANLPPCDVVAFPDDDVWYQPDTVERAVHALRQHGGCVSGLLITTKGTTGRMATADHPLPLDNKSVWRRAMEATCFFERDFFSTAGHFDPNLGVGSPTPWQSGEISDLLLRGLRHNIPVWFNPTVRVYDRTPVDPDTTAYRLKARRYARGTGRVLRRHHGPARCAQSVAAPAAQSVYHLLRGQPTAASLKLQVLLGRAEGIVGAVLPHAP